MARFRGTVAGNRGEASRLGTPSSGLRVTCNGWEGGVTIEAFLDDNGNDTFTIWATGGSGYLSGDGFICRLDHTGHIIERVPA